MTTELAHLADVSATNATHLKGVRLDSSIPLSDIFRLGAHLKKTLSPAVYATQCVLMYQSAWPSPHGRSKAPSKLLGTPVHTYTASLEAPPSYMARF